jgi:predicted DNA-binding transcriptional regulator AlpA
MTESAQFGLLSRSPTILRGSHVWVSNTVQYPDAAPFGEYKKCMKRGPESILPQSLAPRGLSREQAAAYIGISPSFFDMLIKDGRMPGPKRINSRVVWDRLKVDAAFEALADTDDPSIEDEWKATV